MLLKFIIFASGRVVICFPLFYALLQMVVQYVSNRVLISAEWAFNQRQNTW
ncbi:hypothetical protein HMPREF9420_2467 [Segatella salivae DSM 15606]|uniref:Uncharacterized protein n=1 Tax=Segatella salivae DSM 15606 TaxID=888832 RepID=E6MSJ9_9BACT|nr:hypothetical protein HMPREF9420_2467 [Segatella salivae DSM 15606]